jgi:hypothetical protein
MSLRAVAQTDYLPFDRPSMSTIHSFDKLRMNGAEGLRANGGMLKSHDFSVVWATAPLCLAFV